MNCGVQLCGAVIPWPMDDRDMFVGVVPREDIVQYFAEKSAAAAAAVTAIGTARMVLRTNGMQKSGAFYTESTAFPTKRQGCTFIWRNRQKTL